jgi:hypothetical protein
MPTNKETKLSLKEKLYQETLDELVTKVWKYKYMPSWSKFIEYVGEGGSRQKDIEKAVKLAIKKTYDALQDGQLTEVGQTLFDRRKDTEANTATQIFAELAGCQIDVSRLSPEEVIKAIQREPHIYWYWVLDGDKVDILKKKY